jgi:hypothetical protein
MQMKKRLERLEREYPSVLASPPRYAHENSPAEAAVWRGAITQLGCQGEPGNRLVGGYGEAAPPPYLPPWRTLEDDSLLKINH